MPGCFESAAAVTNRNGQPVAACTPAPQPPISLDPGLKFQVSGFEFSESMNDGSMLAHLKSEGRDDHNSLVFIP